MIFGKEFNMPSHYSDPNLDFDLEAAKLKRQLLRADELQNSNDKAILGYGGLIAPWQPGAAIGNALNKFSGRTRERRTNEQMGNLSAEEQARYDALQNQLTSLPQIDMTDPNAIMQDNNARGQIAAEMSKLPMAREQAKKLMNESVKLPQTLTQKVQSQDNLTKMQQARQAQANQLAATKQGYSNTDHEAEYLKWQKKYDYELANPKPSKSDKSKVAPQVQANLDKISLEKATDQRAEMLRSIFTLEEGGNYDVITSGLTGFIGDVLDDKAKYLGLNRTAEGRNQLSNLKGKVTKLAKDLMSQHGKLGNMAVQEWKIITDSIATLDPLTDNFDEVLAEIKTLIDSSDKRARQEYEAKYGVPYEGSTPEETARDTMETREEFRQEAENRRSNGRNNTTTKSEPTVLKTATAPDGSVWEMLSDGSERQVK